MARVTITMEDCLDGGLTFKANSDTPLPKTVNEMSVAQVLMCAFTTAVPDDGACKRAFNARAKEAGSDIRL